MLQYQNVRSLQRVKEIVNLHLPRIFSLLKQRGYMVPLVILVFHLLSFYKQRRKAKCTDPSEELPGHSDVA